MNDQLIQFGHWYLLLDRIRRLWITMFKHPCFAEERYVNKSNSISQTEYATDTGSQRCPIWARSVVGELWCVPGTAGLHVTNKNLEHSECPTLVPRLVVRRAIGPTDGGAKLRVVQALTLAGGELIPTSPFVGSQSAASLD